MNNDLIIAFGPAIGLALAIYVIIMLTRFRHAFLVPEGYAARVLDGNPALTNLSLMQSVSAAQNAGNTLVLGVPGGLVPLKNRQASLPRRKPEDGAS